MSIVRLSETVINRIAAGEVVERPASVVKELMENAVDAGASRVEVTTSNGGKTLIRVSDDGSGMRREDLALSVERHCTSKLSDDLLDIRSLGFRGEALPSIGAVSRLAISSRVAGAEAGWAISVDGGRLGEPRPSPIQGGTLVEVRDLFHATPARLKFLRSDQAEANAITDVFKRMALAFPAIRFSISGADRTALDYRPADRQARVGDVLGRDFTQNALEIEALREGVRLSGLASLPTFHRGNAQWQYFFVNGRPVRDRQLLGAVRGAYTDFVAGGRHPVAVLFLELDPHLVDVNVHPAKADVRFRDAGLVRGLIVGAIRNAIAESGPRASGERAISTLAAFRGASVAPAEGAGSAAGHAWRQSPFAPSRPGGFGEVQHAFDDVGAPSADPGSAEASSGDESGYPLGAARAQLHGNYIIAQTETGLVIVDQHAAHERLVYEALKKGMADGLPGQVLLIPEIVELSEEDASRLMEHAGEMAGLGLVIESFGPGAIAVRETPAMLGEIDAGGLVRDLADEVAEWAGAGGLAERLERVAATMACYGSVRSGRKLKPQEMNALLRQMEATPNSGQCNHGRPTFIELRLKDIERLFGR